MSTPASNSPLSRSFLDASTAIDDLTRSLSDYSRVSTPEPPGCECNAEDSEYTKAWLAVKAKLESRLVLSAEVGQALLQRHEAYVRRVHWQAAENAGKQTQPDAVDPLDPELNPATRRQMEDRIAELSRENAILEKRFGQTFLNNELAEESNKTLSADLQELRVAFNRLSTEHARSVGWEARLRDALQERDDFHQERDSEAQKLRAAETRLASLSDKCAKLDLEARVLEKRLEEERSKRGEASEETLHEAKQWLAGLQHSRIDLTSIEHHNEIMKLLESLMADKEALRKSNTELQELLSESRETLQALQEEEGERLASSPEGGIGRIPSPAHGTAPRPLSPISNIFSSAKHPLSSGTPSHQSFEPLTPETSQRRLSPGTRQRRQIRRRRDPNSDIEIELERGSTTNESDDDATPGKPRRGKSLYSLQRHRAVQTEPRGWNETLSPTGYGDQLSLPISPNEGNSESSSLIDNPSTLGLLLERVQQLFNRIAQADARTLTTRLKRQNILGADVSYLSHSTVDGIIAEVTNLRTIFRAALEDDKFTTICTRRDLRSLLKFFKDIFREFGTLRTTLNDIVLDPSIAPKVREMTMNPKDESSSKEKAPSSGPGGGWMAPLSKLFSSATSSDTKRAVSPLGINRSRGPMWPSVRLAPKLGPATSASTTTVNVEFTGTGSGRAITKVTSPIAQESTQDVIATPIPTRSTSANLMGIFAGAARNDPSWVVLPPSSSRPQGERGDQLRRTTLGRAAGRVMATADNPAAGSLPRNVDAVIDPRASSEERGGIDPARTLRTRGLSDSSIRSTFLQHGEDAPVPQSLNPSSEVTGGRTALSAHGQTIRDVRPAASGTMASPPHGVPRRSTAKGISYSRAASSRFSGLMPDVSSWAAASRSLETADPDDYVGSLISNAPLRPLDRRGGEL